MISLLQSDNGEDGGWWVARALAELLPAVTMVTSSRGACLVQPVSVRRGEWGVKCAQREEWGNVLCVSHLQWRA